MFKKIYAKFDEVFKSLKDLEGKSNSINNRLYDAHDTYEKIITQTQKNYKDYMKTIESQQKVIQQLMGALCDKYEHGLFIFSEDGKIPTVIRNGKTLTNDMTTSFSIDWMTGEFPNIQFEQVGGTWKDDGKCC